MERRKHWLAQPDSTPVPHTRILKYAEKGDGNAVSELSLAPVSCLWTLASPRAHTNTAQH